MKNPLGNRLDTNEESDVEEILSRFRSNGNNFNNPYY
jgi:hypothetical protein